MAMCFVASAKSAFSCSVRDMIRVYQLAPEPWRNYRAAGHRDSESVKSDLTIGPRPIRVRGAASLACLLSVVNGQ